MAKDLLHRPRHTSGGPSEEVAFAIDNNLLLLQSLKQEAATKKRQSSALGSFGIDGCEISQVN